jgi:catechol 2,3-dioxygenase-like lactoylglutathione lyase family enzyme
MIDHVSVKVSDYAKGKHFYEQALAPLGYVVGMEFAEHKTCGLGTGSRLDLWMSESKGALIPTHIALAAQSREMVNTFYEAGIAAGGKDNGKPGIREDYGPNYYAAFVLDPDGNNIEVVYRE